MDKLDNVIRKVEALLEKSRSTTFPEEQSALEQKAQELITKYQVEASIFQRTHPTSITRKEIKIPGPYTIDKITLLNAIAKNNFCKLLRGKGHAVLYGYPEDIKLTLVLYNNLMTDMISEMFKDLKRSQDLGINVGSLVSWKKGYFSGYAHEVYTRLHSARKNQSKEEKSSGNEQYALVVKGKQNLLDEYWNTVSKGSANSRQINSTQGFYTGKSSGKKADIGLTKLSERRAIGK